jgi:hypothetical protein
VFGHYSSGGKEENNMVVPMIILQTAAVIHDACRTRFTDAGFVEGRDYILTAHPYVANHAIEEGGRQLFVTGTFGGDQEAADRFVRSMKERQPNLRVVSFSIYSMNRPPYDVSIDKFSEGSIKRLVAEMTSFMGTLP